MRIRLRGLLLAGPCVAVLAVAWALAPSSMGYGTHEQMGIPPCSFLSRTGWPCPSCGLTTSVAAMAQANVLLAWRAQPFGVVLFAVLVVLAGVGAVELVSNRPVLQRLRPGVWWAFVLVGGMLLGWGYTALTGYLGGRYPLP